MIASPYDEQLARIPVSEHRVDVDGTSTAWWQYGRADAPVPAPGIDTRTAVPFDKRGTGPAGQDPCPKKKCQARERHRASAATVPETAQG